MKENKKNDKRWYEKINIWVTIIASACAILGLSVFDNKALFEDDNADDATVILKENEINTGDQSPIVIGDKNIYNYGNIVLKDESNKLSISETNQQDDKSDDTTRIKEVEAKDNSFQDKKEVMEYVASDNTNDEPEEQVLININTEVLNIREMNNSIPAPKNLPEPTSNEPIYRYHDTNGLTMIKVVSGYKDSIYSRIYYFNKDGNLYFAFVFDKLKENRLYFKDDTLIRYVDEVGMTYDLYDNLDTCEWEEFALKEGYELLNDSN